ncbi:MAG TPA: UDP-N-acetylglucosamine 2-epimerase (non-hydrolyzing) [Thermoanaerobaculia bacterium]|nr:UDP-N-acetylglucosamine 2-epimerase (non-hydrolyzing) [Thermoanaerobaculia bacterium]
MKIVTVFGTRPEIIRLSRVIPVLDEHGEHTLVYTGQNYDPNLSDIFFQELGVRSPDIHLGVQSENFADQIGQILVRISAVLSDSRPDRLLILGDTNSGLAAIVAARMQIPVYHMEAGNRCYDDRVPEEINRRLIDHCSTILMPYTDRSRQNLVREGIDRHRIFVIGNPIYEVLEAYGSTIDSSPVLERLAVRPRDYFLVTLHRSENVDDPARLGSFLKGLSTVADRYSKPVVVSVHPRTADRMKRHGLTPQSPLVRLTAPLGFFDFVKLEKNAFCVLSDSGTVQEECCIFKVPNVTLRDVTERPETIECGSNILSGADADGLERKVRIAVDGADWIVPTEYLARNVSHTVAKIVLGYTN